MMKPVQFGTTYGAHFVDVNRKLQPVLSDEEKWRLASKVLNVYQLQPGATLKNQPAMDWVMGAPEDDFDYYFPVDDGDPWVAAFQQLDVLLHGRWMRHTDGVASYSEKLLKVADALAPAENMLKKHARPMRVEYETVEKSGKTDYKIRRITAENLDIKG